MRQFSIFPGLYDMGSAQDQAMLNAGIILSNILNTRDVFSPGITDFQTVGPGSQAWILGYSVHFLEIAPPADPLGFQVQFNGSFDLVGPFTFRIEQSLILPIYAGPLGDNYSGHVRVESSTVQIVLFNNTGTQLNSVSYQFWGKAL